MFQGTIIHFRNHDSDIDTLTIFLKNFGSKDFQDAYDLLQTSNVNHDKLLAYAREAANFATSSQLPHLDFALNHYQKEDVAMFDFTSLYHAEHAAKIYERKGHRLLALVVGDSLLEVSSVKFCRLSLILCY